MDFLCPSVLVIFVEMCFNLDMSCATNDELSLIRHLLNESRYDLSARPAANPNTSVLIKLEVVLQQIIDLVTNIFLVYQMLHF